MIWTQNVVWDCIRVLVTHIIVLLMMVTVKAVPIHKKIKSSSRSNHRSDHSSKKIRRTLNSPHGILVPKRKSRHIYKKGNFYISTGNENILIINSVCDQSMIHASSCHVLGKTSQYLAYLCRKFGWSQQVFDTIDWAAMK